MTESLSAKKAKPCVLVIFGITGDLTKRLLYPAICNLGSKGLLDDNFSILGIGAEKYTSQTFRAKLSRDVKTFVSDPLAKKFGLTLKNRLHYLSGDFSDPKLYAKVKTSLDRLHKAPDSQISYNYLFYFAVPPQFIQTLTVGLATAKLLDEQQGRHFRRIIVEKPFGHDLASAQALNKALLALIDEQQIFRIDHFLGKETVQNLLAFRFSNGIFEPIWNHHYIDHVQITIAETLGVEARGAYYDQAGALRDMVPNHLLQLLSLIIMEAPNSFTADSIRAEKSKALQAICPINNVAAQAIRGQYSAGVIQGEAVPCYQAEPAIDPHSHTETFVALQCFVDNWRWSKVPFYLRTGKRMKTRASEIIIQFKAAPSNLFNEVGENATANLLRIYLQPDEGISLQFNAKVPGPSLQLGQVDMTFKYRDYFGIKPQTGYETILYDCMNGDHLLFNHTDMIENGWALVQPILDAWAKSTDIPQYKAGTWGPLDADALLTKDKRQWLM